jgi:predicted naringenin-chalcone synthase
VLVLTDFKSVRPLYESQQEDILAWLTQAYLTAREKRFGVSAEGARGRERIEKLLNRYGCSPPRVQTRGHEIPDFNHTRWEEMEVYRLKDNPHGATLGNRMQVYARSAARVFRDLYASPDHEPPNEIVHVTCTGYASPSAAQLFVEARGWGKSTRLTPVYHSGCYAAVPAVRLALTSAAVPHAVGTRHPSIDIVHTEISSLHLDPLAQEPDQMVVHTLFGDGFTRYSVRAWDQRGPALRVLALNEEIVPNTQNEMQWFLEPYCFRMALSRQVPDILGQVVEAFVDKLCTRAKLPRRALQESPFALHPGGPRILEVLQDKLRLSDAQLRHSRGVLAVHGNMSSATLPTIWESIVNDTDVPEGTLFPTLAFGPGLTIAGMILEKVAP